MKADYYKERIEIMISSLKRTKRVCKNLSDENDKKALKARGTPLYSIYAENATFHRAQLLFAEDVLRDLESLLPEVTNG